MNFNNDNLNQLNKAISRFEEAINAPITKENEEFMWNATIQRFEFTIELFWKTLKKILRFEKMETSTPRDVIANAYRFSLIDDEDLWLNMLDDRNLSSHIYSESDAKKMYDRIKKYCPALRNQFDTIKSKYKI